MPTGILSLDQLLRRLHRRLALVEDAFAEHVVSRLVPLRHQDRMFLEGLISVTWQYWCLFCRQLIVASALGCRTRRGSTLAPCVSPATWERVSYIAVRVANNRRVASRGTQSTLRREPTWGDVSKLPPIIGEIGPQNASSLIGAFGSITGGPAHLQVVRNASAHRNHETHRDILGLRPFYNPSSVRHPTDVIMWIDPSSRDYAFVAWIDDMRLISDLATDY